jgi:exosortase
LRLEGQGPLPGAPVRVPMACRGLGFVFSVRAGRVPVAAGLLADSEPMSEEMSRPGKLPSASRTPTAIVLAVVAVAAVAVAYAPTIAWLARAWVSRIGYSHGILVPFVVLYLIYVTREERANVPRRCEPAGLALVVFSLGLVVFDSSALSKAMSGLSIPLVVIGLVWTLAGKAYLKRVIVPILMLFLMCPPPAFALVKIAARVQLLTVSIAAKISNSMFGLQAVADGISIDLPQLYIQTASIYYGGFRTLIAIATFGAFFGYAVRGAPAQRFLVFATGIPLALFASGLRVALGALVANYFGADAMATFQQVSGYLVLFLAFLALLLVAKGFGCEGLRSPRHS